MERLRMKYEELILIAQGAERGRRSDVFGFGDADYFSENNFNINLMSLTLVLNYFYKKFLYDDTKKVFIDDLKNKLSGAKDFNDIISLFKEMSNFYDENLKQITD